MNLKALGLLLAVFAFAIDQITKWLAIDENIALLSEELQIQFENVSVESSAGRYFVDIVADVAENSGKAIIENQLDITNHKHLGQFRIHHINQILSHFTVSFRNKHFRSKKTEKKVF